MSAPYILDPPTKGKILLHTSCGDLDIELWPKEAPKACRNFVQLCMEGYYDNTIFHRVIKDVMVQGGDPTGTGMGGESCFGEPFKDEFHSRVKFCARGRIAMASDGPHSNQSQFFITLAECPWLDRKHTIFGKITGNTIFNALKLGEGELIDDRPEVPQRVTSAEILLNPFDDIVPRVIQAEAKPGKKKKKKKRKKNLKLLSFGEQQEGEDEEILTEPATKKRCKSIHDDPAFSKKVADEMATATPSEEIAGDVVEDVDMSTETTENVTQLAKSIAGKLKKSKTGASELSVPKDETASQFDARMRREALSKKKTKGAEKKESEMPSDQTIDQARSEFESLKRSWAKEKKATSEKQKEEQKVKDKAEKKRAQLYLIHAAQSKYQARRRSGKRTDEEKVEIMKRLATFSKSIHGAEKTPKDLPKSSSSDRTEENGDEPGTDWMDRSLEFAKRPQDYKQFSLDDYTIIDPLKKDKKVRHLFKKDKR
eukprot:17760_1